VTNAGKAQGWIGPSVANLAAFWEHPVRAMGRRSQRWDDAWAADAASPCVFLNSATLLHPLAAADAPALAARLSAFYDADAGGPWLLWSAWPTPDLTPHGFVLAGRPPLMVRPPVAAATALPPELRIEEARGATALGDYERVLIEGYPVPELQPIQAGSAYDARVLGGPFRAWVGYLDGRAVTGAVSHTSAGVVGIYAVATLAEARGKSYGAAVTYAATQANPALPAMLQASDLGRPVYERIGFEYISDFTLWLKPRAVP
jgi:hypothetical protein